MRYPIMDWDTRRTEPFRRLALVSETNPVSTDVAEPELSQFRVARTWMSQKVADGREQFLSVKGLLEHAVGTCADRRQSMQHVRLTADDNNRQFRPVCMNHS